MLVLNKFLSDVLFKRVRAENKNFFFFEETRPRVETEGMTLPQPPESAGQKRRFSRKIWKNEWTNRSLPCYANMSYKSLRCKDSVKNQLMRFKCVKTVGSEKPASE